MELYQNGNVAMLVRAPARLSCDGRRWQEKMWLETAESMPGIERRHSHWRIKASIYAAGPEEAQARVDDVRKRKLAGEPTPELMQETEALA